MKLILTKLSNRSIRTEPIDSPRAMPHVSIVRRTPAPDGIVLAAPPGHPDPSTPELTTTNSSWHSP